MEKWHSFWNQWTLIHRFYTVTFIKYYHVHQDSTHRFQNIHWCSEVAMARTIHVSCIMLKQVEQSMPLSFKLWYGCTPNYTQDCSVNQIFTLKMNKETIKIKVNEKCFRPSVLGSCTTLQAPFETFGTDMLFTRNGYVLKWKYSFWHKFLRNFNITAPHRYHIGSTKPTCRAGCHFWQRQRPTWKCFTCFSMIQLLYNNSSKYIYTDYDYPKKQSFIHL